MKSALFVLPPAVRDKYYRVKALHPSLSAHRYWGEAPIVTLKRVYIFLSLFLLINHFYHVWTLLHCEPRGFLEVFFRSPGFSFLLPHIKPVIYSCCLKEMYYVLVFVALPFFCQTSLFSLSGGATCRTRSPVSTTPSQTSNVDRLQVGVSRVWTWTWKAANVSWRPVSHRPAPEVRGSCLWRQHSSSVGFHLHLLIEGLRGIARRQTGLPLALSLLLNPLLAAQAVALTTLCHCVRRYNTPCDLCLGGAPDGEGVLLSKGLLRFIVRIWNRLKHQRAEMKHGWKVVSDFAQSHTIRPGGAFRLHVVFLKM